MQLFVGAKGLVVYEKRVLLLRESTAYEDRSGAAGKWDMPGGRIKPDETTREGLVREIQEESGLNIAEVGPVLGLFDGFPEIKGEKCHVVRVYFLCRPENDEVCLSGDHDAFEWVDPKHIGIKDLKDDIGEILRRYNREH